MGKSPGKWIKTLLTGKKSSKSRTSKGREISTNERHVLVPVNEPGTHLGLDQPITSQPASVNVATNEVNADHGNEALEVSHKEGTSLLENENMDAQEAILEEAPYDPEKEKIELAATTVQSTFRGFLARRAFRALKGIIRLQALIRGHLVRRQAVATLYCMVGIVKLQAICRGRKIRQSDIGLEVCGRCTVVKSQHGKPLDHEVTRFARMAKLSENVFICKLLSASPAGMPLHIHYESSDPNSLHIWLERWSTSHFWKPVSRPKKLRDPKSRRRLGNSQVSNAETGRPKRSVRRVPAANIESVSVQAISESEKPKRSNRTFSNQPADPALDNPQVELERVKRNLRKVHKPVLENSTQADSEIEKPSQIREKRSNDTGHDSLEQGKQDLGKTPNISDHEVTEQNTSNMSEKINQEVLTVPKSPDMEVRGEPNVSDMNEKINQEVLTVPKSPDVEASVEADQENDSKHVSSVEEAAIEPESLTENPKYDDIPFTNGNYKGSSPKEDSVKKENQKTNKKVPNTVKQECAENGIQNSPSLPSYMQATESAKAKLRLQGSPRLSQDGEEKSNTTRRHSLPYAINSKVSSQSPRTQRSTQSGGIAKSKSDKTPSSKDGTGRSEWKR